jgi:Sulfotransferase family
MREPVLDEPVVVLTGARSGSTLLRYILDTHPDLACPPETNIVKICAQFAGAFGVTGEYAGDDLPPPARAGIQAMVDALFGDHLRRRDRLRWCDKSLGTAPVAEWLLKLYPKTTFICLYRHGMDVVHSGLEACPWGLTGYGFEQFAGARGANSVSSLVAYWIEHTRRILEFERAHGDRCVRVYYEWLVEDPETVASEVFSAIGVEQAPGITGRCFGTTTRPIGPGDHKIGATGKITADSVGRGVRVPVGLIPPPQLSLLNHLLTELDYTPVDDAWQRSACPPALLRGDAADRAAARLNGHARSLGDQVARTLLEKIGAVVQERATAGLPRALSSAVPAMADESGTFKLVAYHADEHRTARCWRVDPAEGTITPVDVDAEADWMVTGDVETWLAVLADRANMGTCVRSGALRYAALRDEDPPVSEILEPGPAQVTTMEHRLTLVRRILCLTGYTEEVDGRDNIPVGA